MKITPRATFMALAFAIVLSLFTPLTAYASASMACPVGEDCDPPPEEQTPDIGLSRTSIDFGSVLVGGNNTYGYSVVVSNKGEPLSALTLDLPVVTGPHAGEFVIHNGSSTCDDASARTLSADESCSVLMVFNPQASGARTATLVLSSDDPDEPSRTVSLAGKGGLPASVSITPANNYGPHTVGTTSASHTFTLSNAGDVGYAGKVDILGGHATDFVRTGGTCAPVDWFTLAGRSSCTIEVAFAPTEVSQRMSAVVVSSHYGQGTVSAGVEGSGVAVPPPPPPAPDTTRPTVAITRVAVRHQQRKAIVRFTGRDNLTPVAGLRYLCQVDTRAKRACTTPSTFLRLKPGRHVVRVWALDRAGNASTPSVKRFRVHR